MQLWTDFVDLLYSALFGLSLVFGGNMGLAIGLLSLSLRLALLPLTLRFAYRSLRIQAAMKRVEPELSKIRKRYKDDPAQLWKETQEIYEREGIRVFEAQSALGLLLQAPLFLGFFAAVRRVSGSRFLWIKDIMQSDPLLAGICAALTGVTAYLGASSTDQQRTWSAVLPTILTLCFLWRMSASFSIYTFSSSVVGLIQSLLIRRRSAKLAA